MICTSIQIQNFRNIVSTEINFIDSINVFVGDNAQGKTNLLEALFFGTLGKSFREKKKDTNLILFDQPSFSVKVNYKEDRENARIQNIDIKLTREGKKLVSQNGVFIRRISELVGDFRTVLFCPDHLAMIKEGPSERRDFLDIAISQLFPGYLSALQKYERVLKQRNKLLKTIRDEKTDSGASQETLDIWSEQIAEWSSVISWHRWSYIQKLEKIIAGIFRDMTNGDEKPALLYDPACGRKEFEQLIKGLEEKTDANSESRTVFQKELYEIYLKQLLNNKEKEIVNGSTLYGAHRDDLIFFLNGKEAREYASQGQQRSLVLSVKLAEGEISKEITGEYPIFLFDDVLSELDNKRKQYLLKNISGKQVIMTTCEEIAEKGSDNIKIWSVREGQYTEEACICT